MDKNKYFILLFAWFFILCSTVSGISSTDKLTAKKGKFTFILHDGLSRNIIPSIKNKLEDNYSRVLADLGVGSINKIKIRIWKKGSAFLEDMQKSIGIKYWNAGGWAYSPDDLRILYFGSSTPQIVLHEFCHAVSLYVNREFGSKSRWLWEAVAIYEANQFVEPQKISYLVKGNFPTIAELNSDFNSGNRKIYQVGYLLPEYIIQSFGKKAYIDLIKSNGNIDSTLGISTQQFENNWKTFVLSKYFRE
jgi:hypothetical protein